MFIYSIQGPEYLHQPYHFEMLGYLRIEQTSFHLPYAQWPQEERSGDPLQSLIPFRTQRGKSNKTEADHFI